MAFEKRSMIFVLMMVMGFYCLCEGTVYKVGDAAGWTDNGKVDYKAWSSSKTFHIGDTILFEYDNRFSNVVRVTHRDFNACSNLHAYFSFNSGNDSFVIPRPGHYYFISGLAGHCQSGQRVDIRVLNSPTPTPAPAPAPSSPSVPVASPPTHTFAPAPVPSSPSGSASRSPAPAPTPGTTSTKHNGVVSNSGMGLASVVAVMAVIFGFSC